MGREESGPGGETLGRKVRIYSLDRVSEEGGRFRGSIVSKQHSTNESMLLEGRIEMANVNVMSVPGCRRHSTGGYLKLALVGRRALASWRDGVDMLRSVRVM